MVKDLNFLNVVRYRYVVLPIGICSSGCRVRFFVLNFGLQQKYATEVYNVV